MFDIRIKNECKEMIGTRTISWMVDYIFNNYFDKQRIEANTRQDNYSMRYVLHNCGFDKEAHYRKEWDGNRRDDLI